MAKRRARHAGPSLRASAWALLALAILAIVGAQGQVGVRALPTASSRTDPNALPTPEVVSNTIIGQPTTPSGTVDPSAAVSEPMGVLTESPSSASETTTLSSETETPSSSATESTTEPIAVDTSVSSSELPTVTETSTSEEATPKTLPLQVCV